MADALYMEVGLIYLALSEFPVCPRGDGDRIMQYAVMNLGGQLGHRHGEKRILALAATWWIIGSFLCGFTRGIENTNAVLALTTIGGALVVPNAMALVKRVAPVGKQGQGALMLFGAMGPVGAARGRVLLHTEFEWGLANMESFSRL
ncbi:MAG: hypothetical protein M1819_006823 [Sarea resinae]|nr:MAG: hypothetical protein M1819_006823 [Sarea resinae]